MSPQDVLAALARGDVAAAAALTPTCRATAWGVEAFGPAGAAELFAGERDPLWGEPHVVRSSRGLALFETGPDGAQQAWVADLHGELITRLWRLGSPRGDQRPEPAIRFAFDAFLSQARAPVAMAASDHPDLAAEAAPAVEGAVAAALAEAPDPRGAERRAFIVRAFAQDDRVAVLAAVHAQGEPVARWLALALRVSGGASVHARAVWDGEHAAPEPFPRPQP